MKPGPEGCRTERGHEAPIPLQDQSALQAIARYVNKLNPPQDGAGGKPPVSDELAAQATTLYLRAQNLSGNATLALYPAGYQHTAADVLSDVPEIAPRSGNRYGTATASLDTNFGKVSSPKDPNEACFMKLRTHSGIPEELPKLHCYSLDLYTGRQADPVLALRVLEVGKTAESALALAETAADKWQPASVEEIDMLKKILVNEVSVAEVDSDTDVTVGSISLMGVRRPGQTYFKD